MLLPLASSYYCLCVSPHHACHYFSLSTLSGVLGQLSCLPYVLFINSTVVITSNATTANATLQSGGSGQYAKIKIEFAPNEEGAEGECEFVSEIKGGSVPKEYIPGVQKGIEVGYKLQCY